jgi:N6-L-threonylcarbamoyladenine synthase
MLETNYTNIDTSLTSNNITILAIESSCDETSASICRNGKILSNVIATQIIHEQYGGVVPELASRAHLQKIVHVVDEALKKANTNLKTIDAFAYTNAPGLLGSLMVGAGFTKSLALANNKPLIEVHHMQAHVLANLIIEKNNAIPSFPFLCLTVSGGHTQIVLCNSPYNMEILGTTLDDAAGEAFDKSAKILGLPYPGGPLIDKYAASGNPKAFKFPEPQIQNLNFSFSGLKTAILYFVQNEILKNPNFINENLNDLCASIQYRIITILLNKLKKAIKQTGVTQICIAGGVSANSSLRKTFMELGLTMKCKTFIPNFEYCTDNAGMIAITAYYKYLQNQFASLNSIPTARASW